MYEYKRVLTDEEVEILGVNPQEWIDGAIDGKLNKCKKRIIKKELENNVEELQHLIARSLAKNKQLMVVEEDKSSGRTEASV